VSELSAVAGTDAHPLFEERPLHKAAIVVMTSDRGQAGAFNANVTKAVERYAANELSGASEVTRRIIRRKGNQHFSRRRTTIPSFDPAPRGATALERAGETANRVIADFKAGKVDRVFVVYNEFKSAISQITRVKQLLPVVAEKTEAPKGDEGASDYTYEP